MALTVEFTIEPFVDVLAAIEAAERSGLAVDVGPFGTSVSGDDSRVLDAVDAIVRAAVAAGATRVSLQLNRRST